MLPIRWIDHCHGRQGAAAPPLANGLPAARARPIALLTAVSVPLTITQDSTQKKVKVDGLKEEACVLFFVKKKMIVDGFLQMNVIYLNIA